MNDKIKHRIEQIESILKKVWSTILIVFIVFCYTFPVIGLFIPFLIWFYCSENSNKYGSKGWCEAVVNIGEDYPAIFYTILLVLMALSTFLSIILWL